MAWADDNESEFDALLDRVEKCLGNLRDFVLPEDWYEQKERLAAMGIQPPIYRGQQGPVAFATSIYGVENLIFLIEDELELAIRFRNLILRSMLELMEIQDEEAGYTPQTAPHGFYFCDDNCAMLNYDMYELFGYYRQ